MTKKVWLAVIAILAFSVGPLAAASSAVSSYLAGLGEDERRNAVIQLGPDGPASDAIRAQLEGIDRAWNAGEHEQALAALRAMEAIGIELTLAFSHRVAVPCLTMDGVQVGSYDGNRGFTLDSHAGTGNLFSVSRVTLSTMPAYMVFLSTDGGATWSSTGGIAADAIPGASAVVVGNFVYIAFITANSIYVQLDRLLASDGTMDPDFHDPLVLSTTSGAFKEVALASTADWDNQRLYLLAVESDGELRYAWADENGSSWTEIATSVTNADRSLDATANHPLAGSGVGLLATYVGTDGDIWTWRRSSSGDSAQSLEKPDLAFSSPRISAWDDTVFVTYLGDTPAGYTKACCSHSTDGAATWQDGPCFGADNTYHATPDVTLRRGAGAALVYQADDSTDDILYFTHAPLGATGGWSDAVRCNEVDLVWGADSVVERLADGDWGVLTTVGSNHALYFDRALLLIMRDGFESGDASGWSSVTP